MKLALCCALAAIIGYLLGSINFAVVVSRLLDHDDIRNYGSGNAGMTNILRVYGKKQAALVLVGDFGKAVAAVLLARAIFNWAGITVMDGGYVGALAVLLGHLFPVFFGFRGGKGILTSAGIMLVLNPTVFVVLVPVVVIIMLVSRIVSLGSVIAAVVYPFATYAVRTMQGQPPLLDTLFAALMAVLVIYMHRANIRRLLNGTESRFGQKKKAEAPKED
ncbi:MAG: glycerol-3-phosphate 1-O-acyltransferase PlsY [Oscillospiraceae bacterium]|nr:glycerol-3-phosphate 1-O-acyltransferase PlsY [Oscillospiraceae bacterium]MBQ9109658.1 glycerol-3-phosphate 1-O-acyltransferase PlsY [Oscillospiraceae bacterium]